MTAQIIELASIAMFFIGFYGIITSESIIKSIASTTAMEMAVIIFFLGIGFEDGMKPPMGLSFEHVADPLPQALVITAIIIGITVTAINLTMLISLCHQSKRVDWDSARLKSLE